LKACFGGGINAQQGLKLPIFVISVFVSAVWLPDYGLICREFGSCLDLDDFLNSHILLAKSLLLLSDFRGFQRFSYLLVRVFSLWSTGIIKKGCFAKKIDFGME